MHFSAGIYTKEFWNIPEEKHFTPLTILILFMKSFVNSFVNIALTFFDSSFNLFLFKSVLSSTFAISLLLATFSSSNLAVIFSHVNLLNFGVVIHLSWWWSVVILFLTSIIFVL